MRETRTSGSVEGVLSNGHPYSDSSLTTALPKQKIRVAGIGAVLLVAIGSFCDADRRPGVPVSASVLHSRHLRRFGA
jgi:hypothetical protein